MLQLTTCKNVKQTKSIKCLLNTSKCNNIPSMTLNGIGYFWETKRVGRVGFQKSNDDKSALICEVKSLFVKKKLDRKDARTYSRAVSR